MIALNHDIDFVHDSKDFADFLLRLKSVYSFVKKYVGKIVSLILSIPVIILLHLIFLIIHWKLRRNFKLADPLSFDNYKKYKKAQIDLHILNKKLSVLRPYKPTTVPLLFKPLVWQVNLILNTIDKYRRVLNSKIAVLNISDDKGYFTIVKDTELWNKRVPVYEYIL